MFGEGRSRPSSSPVTCLSFFFFNDTATTEIYTLSLHDALPIYLSNGCSSRYMISPRLTQPIGIDRKSTRLNSSHLVISYAVFCLKKTHQHHYRSVPIGSAHSAPLLLGHARRV